MKEKFQRGKLFPKWNIWLKKENDKLFRKKDFSVKYFETQRFVINFALYHWRHLTYQLLKKNLLRMYLYRISTRNGLVVIAAEKQQPAMVRNEIFRAFHENVARCVGGEKKKFSFVWRISSIVNWTITIISY